jgi:hypothetical protein
MNDYTAYLLDALSIVSAWDLPDHEIADAANAQAHLMAGCPPDDYYESNTAEHFSPPHR